MSRRIVQIKWLSYAVIAASLLILIRQLPLSDGVAALRTWVDGLGVWGPLAFGLVYVVAVVAMVPASLLTLAAGATFGLLIGTLTVSLAASTGAALALLIARYLARDRIERFAQHRPRFAAFDQAIRERGWKVVALLRLSPAVPFNVQNYLYGLTSIGFWTCVLTSLVAMLPGTFLYVYLGHAAGTVTAVGDARNLAQWIFLSVGLLATLIVTVVITRAAQGKLQELTPVASPEDDADDISPAEPAAVSAEVRSESRLSTVVSAVAAVLLAVLASVTVAHPQSVTQALRTFLPLGPPSIRMTEAYPEAGSAEFDHSTFDNLLQVFVDADGFVDYERLQQNPSQLEAYIESLATAPFEDLGRNDKLALLLNAYNACTLQLILDHWPLASIKDIPAAQRWTARRWNIGRQIWSLEQIEHEQIRARFNEPAIHFALVCAAVGCPPLAREAYSGERLDAQLQRQAEYIHNHSTWLRIDRERDTVALTSLYQWYRGDFEQSAGSIVKYAAQFNQELQNLVRSGNDLNVRFLPYDWSLNGQSNRQQR